MDFVALLATIAAVCTAVWKFGRAIEPPGLVELFRTSHELGWPVGVQEEDVPPAFGSRIAPRTSSTTLAEDGVELDARTLDGSTPFFGEALAAAAARDRAWSARVRNVRLVAGTARR